MRIKIIIICSIIILAMGCKQKNVVVGIQPYQAIEKRWIDTVAKAIESTYHNFDVVILPHKELPSTAFINVKSPRYRADQLIKILREEKPDSLDYIMGLTTRDISTTKKDKDGHVKQPEYRYNDWGILGIGYRPGKSCIVSNHRLLHPDESKFFDRLKKVALHELGHNLNLPHCETSFCLMKDAAETIQTIDQVELRLCDKCQQKIQRNNAFRKN